MAAVSYRSPCSIVVSEARSTAALAYASASGLLAAISWASDRASSMRELRGTTLLTRPMSSASSVLILLPVRISSFALVTPIRRGSRCVPPAPGTMPMPTSGSAKLAPSAVRRKSHARAISSPPPKARPLRAAMVGTCKRARRQAKAPRVLLWDHLPSASISARSP
jgi:hypothetical protein